MGACNVQTVDTTGAGDSFIGFFLHSVLDGKNKETVLQIATVASAIAVTRSGAAASIPHWAEVEAILPYYLMFTKQRPIFLVERKQPWGRGAGTKGRAESPQDSARPFVPAHVSAGYFPT